MRAQTFLAAIVACASVASAAPVAVEAYGPPISPHIISKKDTVEAYGPPVNPHIPAVESKRDGVEAYGPPTNPHIISKKDVVEAYGPPISPHIIAKE
ncbi:uncharacterized protein LY79DRAFT_524846 [Colletotrichum navitas]|uniref:Uncharacterized protein n=1 Tax=Colletotrichum navitas TaxID=681940 RepID=A0AAD8PPG9_9PEZI|nr:uncharacterized protein LY79DRAFT_524846 [Colletotrichum navitas]KAK1573907.1 hypothetical protein LY79DRAFT_524846 [Colletotrichum navitas]